MKQLYIPALGDTLTLAKPWTFALKSEQRNDTLFEVLHNRQKIPRYTQAWYETFFRHGTPPLPTTIPAGTVLTVSRIYIRAGAKDFDSVTFRAKLKDVSGKLRGVRFFASLADVNTLKVK
jgi:hypothetical protein